MGDTRLAAALRGASKRPLGVLLAVLGLGGALLLAAELTAVAPHRKQTLREQFHLPPEIEFDGFATTYKSSVQRPPIEGRVIFSEPQFRAYLAKLDEAAIWKPVPLPYDGTTIIGPYAAEALRWRPLPLVSFAGDRRARWGNLSRKAVYDIKRGRVLCFAIRKTPHDERPAHAMDQPPSYRAAACQNLARGERSIAYVMGVLDEDTRTLHMIIQ